MVVVACSVVPHQTRAPKSPVCADEGWEEMAHGVQVIGVLENGIFPAGELLQGVPLLGDPRSACMSCSSSILILPTCCSSWIRVLNTPCSSCTSASVLHVWLLYHVACCNNIRLMEFFPIHVPLGVGEESTRRKKKVVTHGKDKNSRDGQGIAVMAKE